MEEVIQYLPRYQLHILATVCQLFRKPCQKALFKNVCLQTYKCAEAMRLGAMLYKQLGPGPNTTGLERYVQNIRLDIGVCVPQSNWSLKELSMVLPHMINFKSLTIISSMRSLEDVLLEVSKMLGGLFPQKFERLTICTRQVNGTDHLCDENISQL